jgi:hypothetical protein
MQGPLLEVSQSCVGDVLKRPVPEEFEEWFVVDCDIEVAAAKDKVVSLV